MYALVCCIWVFGVCAYTVYSELILLVLGAKLICSAGSHKLSTQHTCIYMYRAHMHGMNMLVLFLFCTNKIIYYWAT